MGHSCSRAVQDLPSSADARRDVRTHNLDDQRIETILSLTTRPDGETTHVQPPSPPTSHVETPRPLLPVVQGFVHTSSDSTSVSPTSRQNQTTTLHSSSSQRHLPFATAALVPAATDESPSSRRSSSRCASQPTFVGDPFLCPSHDLFQSVVLPPITRHAQPAGGRSFNSPGRAHARQTTGSSESEAVGSRPSLSTPRSLSSHNDGSLVSPVHAARNPLASRLTDSRNTASRTSWQSGFSAGTLSTVGAARAMDAFCADDCSGHGGMLPQLLPPGSISTRDLRTFPVDGLPDASNAALSGTGNGGLGSPWVGAYTHGLHRGIGAGGLFSNGSTHDISSALAFATNSQRLGREGSTARMSATRELLPQHRQSLDVPATFADLNIE